MFVWFICNINYLMSNNLTAAGNYIEQLESKSITFNQLTDDQRDNLGAPIGATNTFI